MTPAYQTQLTSQLIIESAPNAMILINNDGDIAFINAPTEKLFGYTRAELLGQPIEIILAARYAEKHNKQRNMFFGEPKDWVLGAGKEVYACRKDDSEFAADIGLIHLAIDEGSLTLAVIIDLTERKLAEQKQAKSEKRFVEFFENAAEAIVVLDINKAAFEKNNNNALKLFKYNSEQLRTMGMVDISPEFQPDGMRSDKKAAECITHAANNGKMIFEWMIRDAEGIEILCEVRFVILPGDTDQQLLVSFIDIHERKNAEQQLIMDNKRLMFRLENALLGFIEWDDKMQIKFWSKRAEEIFGWSKDEFIAKQKTGFSMVHEDDSDRVNKLAAQTLSGEVDRNNVQYRSYTKSGGVVHCEWFQSVLKDEDGKVLTVMSLVQDITERKEREGQLKELYGHLEERVSDRTAELTEANKALECFSYSVSHDLRAPLRTVVGFTKIIQKDFGPTMTPELKELFDHIKSNGKRMAVIIDDLLKLAKYGKEKLKLTDVDMTTQFSEIWSNIGRTLPNKAALMLPVLPVMKADQSMMEQVLVNLLSNAIKYSSKKEQPIVTIGCKDEQDQVAFFVKDNGVGFNMTQYERLFTAFQRLHSTADFEGIGVGLVLVKRIIEKHGGKVWAESNLGEGATFWFSLPKTKTILNKESNN